MSNSQAKTYKEKVDRGFDESYAKSEFTVNPLANGNNDPYKVQGANKHRAYKWISFNDFRQNGFRDYRGWCALTKETLAGEKYNLDSGIGDGFVHKGSTILAFMPKQIHDQLLNQKKKLIRNTTDNIKSAPKKAANDLSRLGYGKDLLTVEDSESTTTV